MAVRKAQVRYNQKNIKRVPLDMQKEYYDNVLKPCAETKNMSVNAFIKKAIENYIGDVTMKIKDVREKFENQYQDIEVYRYKDPGYHDREPKTDFIESVDDFDNDSELYNDWSYYLMDESEYNDTILSNSSVSADFEEWYGNKEVKILVIMIK